ncbi:hypothetical protein SG34_023985 [Thalassomonas viridans]|uniref:Pesticin C-terminal domain-containing protein n=1 Tax=Thalassomonas viridans TaxID=137584 RepID=A0AAE9Z385_9GAMM|nr:hypothetical protein [Thalassomonas viridans]WDE04367.1 hypothetical protein SG34_023985 [Thalassomonas viridans]
MAITQGLLTYEAEGMEGGPYHSRKLHVPGESSGLTIGRGYDMKEKSEDKIRADLLAAGVAPEQAGILGQAAGLSGTEAKAFIDKQGLSDFEITMEAQEVLFKQTYDELSRDVQRICDKADCVAAYGEVDWEGLDDKIKDVLIDLRYRGDYTPASRKLIQALVAANDLDGYKQVLTTRENWPNVPQDRFNRRMAFLES